MVSTSRSDNVCNLPLGAIELELEIFVGAGESSALQDVRRRVHLVGAELDADPFVRQCLDLQAGVIEILALRVRRPGEMTPHRERLHACSDLAAPKPESRAGAEAEGLRVLDLGALSADVDQRNAGRAEASGKLFGGTETLSGANVVDLHVVERF